MTRPTLPQVADRPRTPISADPEDSVLGGKWTEEAVLGIFRKPLLDLVFEAASVHRRWHDPSRVQQARLLSVKTGGCPEDCGYCPQSARYHTNAQQHRLLPVAQVKAAALQAANSGATRFCIGAAWREVKDGEEFERVLEMVSAIRELGMEACATLGMLNAQQAQRLKAAGLTAYNHNLDTSETYYEKIISTRTYQDRLGTLRNVAAANLSICSGGILGLGESNEDRCSLLASLANFRPQPESVPINLLVPVEGTPLARESAVDCLDLIRTVATARILMPRARIRLSAGRRGLSREAHALAFLAGANSIFGGETLLTTPNLGQDQDLQLLSDLGLQFETP